MARSILGDDGPPRTLPRMHPRAGNGIRSGDHRRTPHGRYLEARRESVREDHGDRGQGVPVSLGVQEYAVVRAHARLPAVAAMSRACRRRTTRTIPTTALRVIEAGIRPTRAFSRPGGESRRLRGDETLTARRGPRDESRRTPRRPAGRRRLAGNRRRTSIHEPGAGRASRRRATPTRRGGSRWHRSGGALRDRRGRSRRRGRPGLRTRARRIAP